MKNRVGIIVLLFSIKTSCFAQSADSLTIAKEKAEKFFKENSKTLSPQVLLVMDYICRYYGVKPPVDAHKLVVEKMALPGSEHVNLFRGFIDSTYTISKEQIDALKNSTDRMTLYAIYCHHLRIPPDTLTKYMTDLANTGYTYQVTHALLAFHLVSAHRCVMPAAGQCYTLRKTLMEVTSDAMKNTTLTYDQLFELHAFARLAGITERTSPEVLNTLLATQGEDGGWQQSAQLKTGNDHTTLLAYLLLLQSLQDKTK